MDALTLIDACRAGDDRAIEELILTYQQPSSNLTGPQPDTQDPSILQL